MRVLYLYCHPLPESFHAGVRDEALAGLKAAGHEIDFCDLYAENFDPILTEEGRRHYHDPARNKIGVEGHVERLQKADALVVQFPTWCFGPPAMLKGYFEKLLMPGVAFDISNPARVKPLLRNIRSITGIVTYGRPRWMTWVVGDLPRRVVMRYLWLFTAARAKRKYLALYHMNVATLEQRKAFMPRVKTAMAAL